MDQQIKLRNSATEQECDFDTTDAAQNFMDNVEDSQNWKRDGAASVEPKAEAPAPTEAELLSNLLTDTGDAPTLTEVIEPAPTAATEADAPAAE